MISELKPESIFDPTAGTCTIGEVGESLGIPWLGCELNAEYRTDIEYRIYRGIERKEQRKREGMQRTLM
jgi:DNA modification methylase